jgi:activating signal cointegrator 1
MKALTLWQPWASLVAMGEKKVETRCWSTKYRGELAIHAAAKSPPKWLGASREFPEFRRELADVFCARERDLAARIDVMLPRGVVLCVVRLVDIQTTDEAAGFLCQRELIFGNYEEGRYAWFFEMVERFETPVPARGNRLLWNWLGARDMNHGG